MLSSISGADISRKIQNKQSIATIVGIIDGCGSVGACIGQIIIGNFLMNDNWEIVFTMMSAMTLLSCLPILGYCYSQSKELLR